MPTRRQEFNEYERIREEPPWRLLGGAFIAIAVIVLAILLLL